MKTIERIGHRGAPAHVPENTLASFDHAATCGVDAIELDVRLAADGQVIVLHDATLDRTTTGSGPAALLTADELAAYDVPRYAAVLDLLRGRCQVTCEVKEAAAWPAALEITRAADALATTVFTCFDHGVIEALRAAEPACRAGGLTGGPDAAFIARMAACGAELADVLWSSLTAEWTAAAQAAGLRVRAWTCNDEAALRHALAAGADGLMSDDPAWLLACLGADGTWLA